MLKFDIGNKSIFDMLICECQNHGLFMKLYTDDLIGSFVKSHPAYEVENGRLERTLSLDVDWSEIER